MTDVRFATICDAENCGNRSEEYTAWPTCRGCHLHACPDHTVPGSLQQHERDRSTEDGTVAVMTETVYCTTCKTTWGAE